MEEGVQKGEENVSKGWRKCFKRVERKKVEQVGGGEYLCSVLPPAGG